MFSRSLLLTAPFAAVLVFRLTDAQQECSWTIDPGSGNKDHFEGYGTAVPEPKKWGTATRVYHIKEKDNRAPVEWFEADAGTLRIFESCPGWLEPNVCWKDWHYGQRRQGIGACIQFPNGNVACKAVNADESCDWKHIGGTPPESVGIWVQV